MRAVGGLRVNVGGVLQYFLALLLGMAVVSMIGKLSIVVALGAVVAGGFCVLFLRRPELGLLIVLLVRASTDASFSLLGQLAGPGGVPLGALPNIGLILILIFGGGIFILARGVPMISLPGGRLLLLLLLVGLVGMMRSESLLIAVNDWFPVLAGFVVYALAAYLFRSPRGVQRAVDVMAVSFVLPVVFGLYQLVTSQGVMVQGLDRPRIFGTFVHPNPFGFYLVLMIGLFLCQAVSQTGKRKALALVALVPGVLLLVGTFARVAWVGAMVVLLVVGILRSRAILLMVPIAMLIAFSLVPVIGTRAADPLGGSFADRLYSLWPATLREWQRATDVEGAPFVVALNRLAGLGPGAGQVLSLRGYGMSTPPHNDYLRILVEYGVFGLAVFLALVVVLAIFAFRTWKASKGVSNATASVALAFLSLAVAFPIMSLTDNVFAYTANQVYFWSLAGITVAIHDMVAQHDKGKTLPMPPGRASLDDLAG